MEIKKRKPMSEETKRKIGNANKGRYPNMDTRKNMSNSHKGKKQSKETINKVVESRKGYKHSEETKRKISIALKNSDKAKLSIKKAIEFARLKNMGSIPWNRGKNTGFIPKTAFKKGQFSLDKHPNWKGGITPLNKNIRNSKDYSNWRKAIFERDNYTCQECGKVGGYLEAHHSPKSFAQIIKENNIKTFEQALECKELWDINNGITLCLDCHKLTDNYSRRKI